MKRLSLYFTSPGLVEVRQEPIPPLAPDQILVETLVSAISPGTEGLVYGGLFPDKMSLDDSLAALSGEFSYPLKHRGEVARHRPAPRRRVRSVRRSSRARP